MGLTHLVQKIVLCVIDVIIIAIFTTQVFLCIKFVLIDNKKVKGTEIFSCGSLLLSLFVFIIIFKNNITTKYNGLIATAVSARFFILIGSIPGPLLINDMKIQNVLNANEIKRSQFMVILLIITVLLFMGSIILEIIVKYDTKVIQDIILKSLAIDNNSLIPDSNEPPLVPNVV